MKKNKSQASSSRIRFDPLTRSHLQTSNSILNANDFDVTYSMGDDLAESLQNLLTSVSSMVKSELQGTNNQLDLLEKMNMRVASEYDDLGDVAAGLRVFAEQMKSKSGGLDEFVGQMDAIEKQVSEFEAVISVLDRYVSLLESKVRDSCRHRSLTD